MKFQVTMKDPDVLYDAIKEALEKEIMSAEFEDDEERDMILETRQGKVAKICAKWFGFGEYLTVEIDTEKKTCTVVPNAS